MKRFLQACSEHVPTLVLAAMLGAGFFFSPDDLPKLTLCIFKKVFLIDCPGCGLTHAFLSIPRGDLRGATAYNAASVPLYLFFMTLFARRVGVKAPRFVSRFSGTGPASLAVSFVALLLIGQWGAKVYIYFETHSFAQYLAALKGRPLSDLAFMGALWQAI